MCVTSHLSYLRVLQGEITNSIYKKVDTRGNSIYKIANMLGNSIHKIVNTMGI